jgi:lambda repressor-like predicted transcriptional regulator
MKKTFKILGAATLLAAMIPIGAYAATVADAPQKSADKKEDKRIEQKVFSHLGPSDRVLISQDVLDLLKLDKKTLQAKLAEGKTLAQIAEEQGVSRDSLKQALTDSFNKKLEEQKSKFAENLDKMVDSKLPGGFGDKKDFVFKQNPGQNISEAAKLLGISNEDLKKALVSGKSLADLAKEKGVEVQTLIDGLANPLTAKIEQELKDGKITQEQADQRKADIVEKITKWVNSAGFPAKQAEKFKHREKQNQQTEETTQTQQ